MLFEAVVVAMFGGMTVKLTEAHLNDLLEALLTVETRDIKFILDASIVRLRSAGQSSVNPTGFKLLVHVLLYCNYC